MGLKQGWTGRFFEDFEIGDVYQHPLGRTVTETDNTWFTLLTMNTNEMHFNAEYAARSEFGKPLVVSTLTVAIAVGQSVTDLTQNAFANLGWDEIRMTHPVFAGDTLYSESLVLEKRESASRPHAGIVTVRTRELNQDGDEVCSFKRTFYVYRRGAEQLENLFPAGSPRSLDGTQGNGMRLTYQPWGESLAELADAGRRAERAGAEVLWAPELHRSATVTAAALAGATSTARIGTSIALAFTRSPMITALEALDLDELSGGRFVLGLGSGVRRLNEHWHNVPFGKPVGHLRETVRNIRQFWDAAPPAPMILPTASSSRCTSAATSGRTPCPRRPIPVYLAAMGPLMTRLAGEIGDGWISHELCSPAYLREHILPDLTLGIDRADGKTRHDVDVVVSACCSVADDPALARRRAAGLVGFYATVRTYADFFAFHGLAEEQQAVIDAFRAGRGADHLAGSVATGWSTRSPWPAPATTSPPGSRPMTASPTP